MRMRNIKPVAAAAMAAVLAIVASPTPAHAAPGAAQVAQKIVGSPVPLSVVLSSSSFAVNAYGLKNQKSKKFAQPSGSSTASYTKIVQENFTGYGIQAWYIVNPGTSYRRFQNYAAAKNMGIDGASTTLGKAAIIAPPDGSLNQDWTILPKDDTYFRLKNRKSGLCLGISGASTAIHALAAQFPCDNTTNQTWSWTN
jgi:hypothetical protein